MVLGDYLLDQSLLAVTSLPDGNVKSKDILFIINNLFKSIAIKCVKGDFLNDINIDIENKINIILYICKMRLETGNVFNYDEVIGEMKIGKYKDYVEYIESKRKVLEDIDILNLNEYFSAKKKLYQLTFNKDRIKELLNDIEIGNYEDQNEIINRWEVTMSNTYQSLMDVKREESVGSAVSLNLLEDTYDNVLERFSTSAGAVNTIDPGYKFLRDSFTFGGFERRRSYMFGGETGIGKSTMLINILVNGLKNSSYEKQTFLYITAENLIDESLLRFYSCLTGEYYNDVVKNVTSSNEYRNNMMLTIKSTLKRYNKNIRFFYVEQGKATLKDIEGLMDYCNIDKDLSVVLLDYIDCIRSGSNNKELRLELGEVAMGLKKLAVSYDISLITATQLNRSGYNVDSSPSITQIGESIKKAEDSDLVIFLQNAKEGLVKYKLDNDTVIYATQIRATILKNRAGASGKSCNLLLNKEIETPNGRQSCFNFRIIEPDKSMEKLSLKDNSDLDKIINDELDMIDEKW